jgi:hypothetical protein
VLTSIGIVRVLAVAIGVIITVFQGPSFADAPVIFSTAGPFGALIATWPIALVQGLKAIVDVAECVSSPTDSAMGPPGGESVFDVRIGFCALTFGIAGSPKLQGSEAPPSKRQQD